MLYLCRHAQKPNARHRIFSRWQQGKIKKKLTRQIDIKKQQFEMRIFKICLFVSLTTFAQTSFAQWEVDRTRTDTITRKRNANRVSPLSFKHTEIFTTSFLKSLPSINLPALNNDSIVKFLDTKEKDRIEKYKYQTGQTIVPISGPYYSGTGIKDTIDLKAKAQG